MGKQIKVSKREVKVQNSMLVAEVVNSTIECGKTYFTCNENQVVLVDYVPKYGFIVSNYKTYDTVGGEKLVKALFNDKGELIVDETAKRFYENYINSNVIKKYAEEHNLLGRCPEWREY